jgi:hypothetical protein
MADVWTSHSELVSRVVADIKSNDEAHTAMANALHRKYKTLDDVCVKLQDKCKEYESENSVLKVHITELEDAMRGAQKAAWGTIAEA